MRRLIVAFLLLGACGSSGGGLTPTEQALQGNWIFQVNAYEGVGLTFKPNEYVLTDLRIQSNGSLAAEVETGPYSATASTLSFFPDKWSCTGSDPAYTMDYNLTGGSLLLAMPSAVVSFVHNDAPPGGSAVVLIGCFASDGSFTQQPLAPL